jgi:predicted nucleotidyltransferase
MKKLTQTEAIQLLKRFIELELSKKTWFSKIKEHVKAIVFYGSTAKQLNRSDSDIDILIFVPLKIEERYTKGEYFYKFEGREVNIVLRSIERLRKLSKEHNNAFEREVFRKSKIIFESDDEVRILFNKI